MATLESRVVLEWQGQQWTEGIRIYRSTSSFDSSSLPSVHADLSGDATSFEEEVEPGYTYYYMAERYCGPDSRFGDVFALVVDECAPVDPPTMPVAPTVSIASFSLEVTGSTISGTSTDADEVYIEVKDPSQTVAYTQTISTSGSWSDTFPALNADTTYTASVVARDSSFGRTSDIKTATDSYTSVEPSVSISSFSLDVSGTSISGSSTDADSTTIEIRNPSGTTVHQTTTTQSSWNETFSALDADTTYTAYVYAENDLYNTTSSTVTATDSYASVEPSVSISSFSVDDTGGSLSGSYSDADNISVTITEDSSGTVIDSTNSMTVSGGAWSYSISSTDVTAGETYTASVFARNTTYNTTSNTVTQSATYAITANPSTTVSFSIDDSGNGTLTGDSTDTEEIDVLIEDSTGSAVFNSVNISVSGTWNADISTATFTEGESYTAYVTPKNSTQGVTGTEVSDTATYSLSSETFIIQIGDPYVIGSTGQESHVTSGLFASGHIKIGDTTFS